MKSKARRLHERLDRILLENSMTFDRALKIFNLNSIPDPKELKSLHRKLAILNHPDKGGSSEKMAEINAAYDYLVNHPDETPSSTDWKDSFNDLFKSMSKNPSRSKKIFKYSKDVAKEVEHNISSVAEKISSYLSDLYQKATGDSTSFKVQFLEDKIDNFLSLDPEDLERKYNPRVHNFGYYFKFYNSGNIDVYLHIDEHIYYDTFKNQINRRTEVSMEYTLDGVTKTLWFGVTSDGFMKVDSEEFYNNPVDMLSDKERELSRIFR